MRERTSSVVDSLVDYLNNLYRGIEAELEEEDFRETLRRLDGNYRFRDGSVLDHDGTRLIEYSSEGIAERIDDQNREEGTEPSWKVEIYSEGGEPVMVAGSNDYSHPTDVEYSSRVPGEARADIGQPQCFSLTVTGRDFEWSDAEDALS